MFIILNVFGVKIMEIIVKFYGLVIKFFSKYLLCVLFLIFVLGFGG